MATLTQEQIDEFLADFERNEETYLKTVPNRYVTHRWTHSDGRFATVYYSDGTCELKNCNPFPRKVL